MILLSLFLFTSGVYAQTDSSLVQKNRTSSNTHYDSLYMAKLNNSGNLMIAGGVGLMGAAGYLTYQGVKIYKSLPDNPASSTYAVELDRNHRQGTIYLVAAGVGYAAGAVLIGLGARNKVEFKNRKKMLEIQSGILDNGNLGLALNF